MRKVSAPSDAEGKLDVVNASEPRKRLMTNFNRTIANWQTSFLVTASITST
jgi:hypothetical protein